MESPKRTIKEGGGVGWINVMCVVTKQQQRQYSVSYQMMMSKLILMEIALIIYMYVIQLLSIHFW